MAGIGTPSQGPQPYYPSKFKTGELHEDFRRLYDHMYAQQRRNAELESQLAEMTDKHAKLSAQVAGGPSTTKIAGLYVKGVQPTNGQQLTYNSSTGQIEWQ
jgi:hypothetical protein